MPHPYNNINLKDVVKMEVASSPGVREEWLLPETFHTGKLHCDIFYERYGSSALNKPNQKALGRIDSAIT